MKNTNKKSMEKTTERAMTLEEVLKATRGTAENLATENAIKVAPKKAETKVDKKADETPKATTKVNADVIEATKKALANAKTEAKVEAKTEAKVDKKAEKKAETKVTEQKAEAKTTEKKKVTSMKKAEPKEKKAEAKVEKKAVETKVVDAKEIVVAFAEEIVTPLGKAVKVDGSIDTVDKLNELCEKEEVILATYWTARLLKQFDYDALGVGTPVKSFPQDLDLLQPVFIPQNGKAVYCVSQYTEVMYTILANELAFDEANRMRYTQGIEYNIYKIVKDKATK